MKKGLFICLLLGLTIQLSSCKKDYACKATSSSGSESVFNCENCSKKDVEDYEASILESGYASAECSKK